MITREQIAECRAAVEELALEYGCPTVLFELIDALEAGAQVEVVPPVDPWRVGLVD